MSTPNSTALVQPYLFFGGRCEEAVEFYRTALGAEVQMLMRFKESPEPHPEGVLPPGSEDKIMHASLRVGGAMLMMSDGMCRAGAGFEGFSLSLALRNEADANRAFTALADGGEVQMPLTKTFWSPCFGMLKDRFDVGWMVSVEEM